MNGVVGFMYPNEYALQWSILIVLYPYITGLVAGAFILASLERVFRVEAVKPTYRLALLTALAFLLDAPLPLQLHLGHPERSPEMYFTPHATSAMAMFGYVYLWYLMAVLVFEIWLDYRRDIVILSQQSKGLLRVIYKIMTLGSSNISERSLRIDEKVGWIVTLIGIPSAFLLHGYVGFIFGSIKANPWWSSPLMPVVFIFSAMVSGVAAVMLIYMATTKLRKLTIDMHCVDTIAMYMFYIFIIDFSLEMLDLIHRIYEADESFRSLDFMVHTKLFFSQIVLQIILGTLVPLVLLFITQVWKNSLSAVVRKRIYVDLRIADHDQRLRHALECGDRRTAVLEELSRLHDLQGGAGFARRPAGSRRVDHSAPALPVGAGQAAASVAREEPAPGCGRRLSLAAPRDSGPGRNHERSPGRSQRLRQRVRLLEQHLEELERRIDDLERPLTEHWPQPAMEVESATLAAASIAAEPPAQPGNLFTVFGKALLGIAGAYVLRAIEETSTLPSLTAAAIGIVYAFLWLVWAARVKSGPQLTSCHLRRHLGPHPGSHALGADPAL